MFTPPKKGERRGGRQKGSLNKSTLEIRAMAQAYGPAALRVAARLMRKAENEATQLAAAKELLERGYGKSMQPHTGAVAVGTYDLSKLANLSDEEFNALFAVASKLAGAVEGASADGGVPSGGEEAAG